MRLTDFFIVTFDLAAAAALLRDTGNTSVQLRAHPSSAFPALYWSGELTAANAETYWTSTIDHIAARSLVQRSLLIDLSKLSFVDSTGLGMMIRTRKHGTRQGIKKSFTDASPNVLNVMRLARLEEYLMRNEE